MNQSILDNRKPVTIILVGIYLLIGLFFIFSDNVNYYKDTTQKLNDLIQVKLWLLISIILIITLIQTRGEASNRYWIWILLLSVYFIVLYALIYKGSAYGIYGHWGDNGNRLALVEKFRAYSSPFQDWYYKDLPSFYPPLWFYVSGKLAWLFDIESYKTIKYGYFVIFLLYPSGLFFVWSKLTSKRTALIITVLIFLFRDIHLDYVYYEHITAAMFIPWWLYYVEDVKSVKNKTYKWYLLGGLLGGLIFLTYYYWFFLGFASVLLYYLLKLFIGNKWQYNSSSLFHKFKILASVGVFSSVFWLPLIVSIFKFGSNSMQSKWFGESYLDFNLPIFSFDLVGIIFLIGVIYLIVRRNKRINRAYILILSSILVMLIFERLFNLTESSIQTRKIRELLPVFLLVSSGMGLSFLYGYINRKSEKAKRVFVVLMILGLIFVGVKHSNITKEKTYKVGMDCVKPANQLAVFNSVDYKDKVFLTNEYISASYLPYYFFLCHWGASTHTASQYNDRIAFLRFVGSLEDPRQVAYLLKNNKFDKIDYFYLPYDKSTKTTYFEIYPLYFPGKSIQMRLDFPESTTYYSPYFVKKHNYGLFEVVEPKDEFTSIFGNYETPDSDESLVNAYNQIAMTRRFLSDSLSVNLINEYENISIQLNAEFSTESEFEFDNKLELLDISIVNDSSGEPSLRILMKSNERMRSDYKIFVHAYPENSEDLNEKDNSKGFTNCDIDPAKKTSSWIKGEYVLLKRDLSNLTGKRYKFHIGLYNKSEGRLRLNYWSDYHNVDSSGQ